MNNITKEVLATDLSTFNMTKKTKFNACFNQGEFEDMELYYFEGTKSSELDWSKDWDDTCEKIMIEINSLQDFINDEVRTYFTLVCENDLIKIGFYDASPGMEGEHYEFTITNNENGEIVVSDLEMTESGYLCYDEEDYDEDDEEDYDDDDE